MAAEDFFNRWNRRKPEADGDRQPATRASHDRAPENTRAAEQANSSQPPTLLDVDRLQPDSDYAAFMASDVDQAVRRSAMKKLFSDPHFNVMDGLDVYIEDYGKSEPIPAAMLDALNHAKALLDPQSQFEDAASSLLAPAPDRSAAADIPAEMTQEMPHDAVPPAMAASADDESSRAPAQPPSVPDAKEAAEEKMQMNAPAPDHPAANEPHPSRS